MRSLLRALRNRRSLWFCDDLTSHIHVREDAEIVEESSATVLADMSIVNLCTWYVIDSGLVYKEFGRNSAVAWNTLASVLWRNVERDNSDVACGYVPIRNSAKQHLQRHRAPLVVMQQPNGTRFTKLRYSRKHTPIFVCEEVYFKSCSN